MGAVESHFHKKIPKQVMTILGFLKLNSYVKLICINEQST